MTMLLGFLVCLVTILLTAEAHSFLRSSNRFKKPLPLPSTPELVHSFVSIEYDFGSDQNRERALQTKAFIPKNNWFSRLEPYKGDLYFATPRFKSGVPFTVVKLVEKPAGNLLFEPFPDPDGQTLGDCKDIQQCCSFQIDPHTDTMWTLDGGHIVFPDDDDPFKSSFCPAKLLAIKVGSRQVVHTHLFSDSVVPLKTAVLNDLVLDYANGELAFIYISETNLGLLIVYDVKRDTSFQIDHPSFKVDPSALPTPFPLGLPSLEGGFALNGIAMSCDFRYVYLHVFTGFDFYRIPTFVLRNGGKDFDARLEFLGRRNHVNDAMTYSTKHVLYYTPTNESAVDRWQVGTDACRQGSYRNVKIDTVQRIAQDFQLMEFTDAVAIDENGFLYFTAERLNRILGDFLDITGGNGTNFHVWRIKLNDGERNYLWRAPQRTAPWRRRVPFRCDRLY